MRKRSLTLLETLIALVLLVAMAALIMPSMLKSMEERTFESAADATNDQLMMARAHAQATGSPVEVMYRPDRSQVSARFFRSGDTAQSMMLKPQRDSGDAALRNLGPLAPEPTDRPNLESDQTEIAESWAIREISPEVRIVARDPSSVDEDQSSSDSKDANITDSSANESFEQFGEGEEIRLAVFMPDGSALVGEPVWLNDDHGRVGVLTINPWSGIPVFQRLGEMASKASAEKTRRDADQSEADRNVGGADATRESNARSNRRPRNGGGSGASGGASDFNSDEPAPWLNDSGADDE